MGLVDPIGRNTSGYRIYDNKALKSLRFIVWAKELGFTLVEIRGLLSLETCTLQSCDEVRERVLTKLMSVESQVKELVSVRDELRKLVVSC